MAQVRVELRVYVGEALTSRVELAGDVEERPLDHFVAEYIKRVANASIENLFPEVEIPDSPEGLL